MPPAGTEVSGRGMGITSPGPSAYVSAAAVPS